MVIVVALGDGNARGPVNGFDSGLRCHDNGGPLVVAAAAMPVGGRGRGGSFATSIPGGENVLFGVGGEEGVDAVRRWRASSSTSSREGMAGEVVEELSVSSIERESLRGRGLGRAECALLNGESLVGDNDRARSSHGTQGVQSALVLERGNSPSSATSKHFHNSNASRSSMPSTGHTLGAFSLHVPARRA